MSQLKALALMASILCSGMLMVDPISAQQPQFATPAEAKALFDKAALALKSNKSKALDMFNKGEGGFRDRDLYVFCFDAKTGIFNAHIVKTLLGTDIRLLKERDGTPFGQKIFDAVKEGAVNTVGYNFPRPGSDIPVAKESFVTAVDGQACGVGYYK